MKRPDELELLREALNDLSDLPDGTASTLLQLAEGKDGKDRAAAMRQLLEELSR